MIEEEQEIKYQIYSPASVLGIFNNALRLPQTVSLIHLKGRYTAGQGKSYAGYYYDYLYSESNTVSIGIKVSSLLRSKLINSEVYTLKGFIEKNIKNSSIELRFFVEEIVQLEEKQISEEDLQRYEIIQKKLEKGSQDLESFIKVKKLKNEPIRIANIFGHSAIVQKDFQEGLDVSSSDFEITEYGCNITSSTSILQKLQEIEKLDFDIIALVRGGGDKQSFDAFNDIKLAQRFLEISLLTITAIGHTVDETLIDKISDKKFHLPHDYGSGLHNIIDKLSQEKSNSRAILIDEVKKDVTKQFTEQVNTLGSQLKKKNEEFVEAQKTYKEQVENQTKSFNEQLIKRNQEVEELKKDLSQKHLEQVQTLSTQLQKKNEEFVESQKTYKEHVENQTKSFNDQLKNRNVEVEKLKSDLSEKHAEQVKTLTIQLTKKNDEFQKLQEINVKEFETIHKNYQVQQANRLKEMEENKREIASLHEKNLQSAVNEKTAQLFAKLSTLEKELEISKSLPAVKSFNVIYFVVAILLGLLLGFIFFKIL